MERKCIRCGVNVYVPDGEDYSKEQFRKCPLCGGLLASKANNKLSFILGRSK